MLALKLINLAIFRPLCERFLADFEIIAKKIFVFLTLIDRLWSEWLTD